MKKYGRHLYADCDDPKNHHKKGHWNVSVQMQRAEHIERCIAKAGDSCVHFEKSIDEKALDLLRRGLECGVFDDAPVFKRDVKKLLRGAL